MRHFLSIIIVFCVSLSAVGLNRDRTADKTGAKTEKSGHIQLDSCSFDFGRIRNDTIAEAILNFRNTGTAPFQILSTFSDCGCTTSDYPEEPIEPGQTGELKIRFNPKGRGAGPFRKTLRIRTNADNPRVVVVVKGYVGGEVNR